MPDPLPTSAAPPVTPAALPALFVPNGRVKAVARGTDGMTLIVEGRDGPLWRHRATVTLSEAEFMAFFDQAADQVLAQTTAIMGGAR
ncbi:MAG: hypothetical protein RQ833_11695 [Sphingomonadaceae bacterium]|nr:hypothetical protein [Sphingomonadaceae bacterium]